MTFCYSRLIIHNVNIRLALQLHKFSITYHFHIPSQMFIITYFLNSCTKYKWGSLFLSKWTHSFGVRRSLNAKVLFNCLSWKTKQSKTKKLQSKHCYHYEISLFIQTRSIVSKLESLLNHWLLELFDKNAFLRHFGGFEAGSRQN